MDVINLRIAMAQINTTVGDLDGNSRKIIEYIEKAEEFKADIVVFPELSVTGYPPEDLLLKADFIRGNKEHLKYIAKKTKGITAIVGFADKSGDTVYNAAGILNNGKFKGVYYKIYLPNYGVFDEKRYFQPGSECPVFVINGVVTGVNICEDIWYYDGPPRWQAKKGRAELIINISSSPYHAGKGGIRKRMLSKRARENNCYIVYNNLVGGQDELVFDGNGFIFDKKGKLITQGKQFEEDIVFADIKIEGRYRKISKQPGKTPSLKVIKISEKITNDKKPPLPETPKYKPLNKLGEIYNALVLGTRDYVRKNGFSKIVIGLSGGIDSALTAVIAVDALGKDNVIGVSMPSPFSSVGSIKDSEDLSNNLGIRLIKISISNLMDTYDEALEGTFEGLQRDTTEENIQARIRGNIVMALSNKFGWLVLTTGNKSEISTGYCTLYGDMAGGFAILKDVPKTLVYELAKHKNSIERREIITRDILEKEPSAELKPNQRDADTLPPYPVLDPILHAYVEEDKSIDEIVRMGYKMEMVRRVIGMVDRNEYKRRQASPGVKITPKAFGKDRRLPITNRYQQD
ncbi:MAG: NAD+ synthase [Nitrospinae bacterium RIFCSPLOWO2_12_39_16]|nr:MAG: NAD+ synthase [Nitrospinae bacterium RIFCSPLOWO2_02_39_17]OGW11209.1 MAG: NAD+ synthase [Nitrospinae bacterium RIFCSPLOWO2_12_39_16]